MVLVFSAGLTGNILLRAYGPTGDVLINANAAVISGTGNITIQAQDDVVLDAAITTAGQIYIDAGNATVDAPVDGITLNVALTGNTGDLLLRSDGNVLLAANVQTLNGNLGVVAGLDVIQQANLQASNNVLVSAGGSVRMTSGTQTVGTNFVLVDAGNDIELSLVQAVSILAWTLVAISWTLTRLRLTS